MNKVFYAIMIFAMTTGIGDVTRETARVNPAPRALGALAVDYCVPDVPRSNWRMLVSMLTRSCGYQPHESKALRGLGALEVRNSWWRLCGDLHRPGRFHGFHVILVSDQLAPVWNLS